MIDVKTLNTLSDRDFTAGLAEVIKYGMIYDGDFFSWLEVNIDKLVNRDREALISAITRSCAIKAAIGMVVAAKLAKQLNLCTLHDVERLVALLAKCNLPVQPPSFAVSSYVEAMSRDKKVQDGVLRMIFNRGIGNYEICSVAQLGEKLASLDLFAEL